MRDIALSLRSKSSQIIAAVRWLPLASAGLLVALTGCTGTSEEQTIVVKQADTSTSTPTTLPADAEPAETEPDAAAETEASQTDPPPATKPPTPTPAEPVVQSIPGTAISLELVPIAGSATVKPFHVSRAEITWDLYDVFVFKLDQSDNGAADAISRPSKPYIAMDRGYGHAGYPAISMSAHGAKTFCEWMSSKTGHTYRLPTEAEWKHLCATSGLTDESMDTHAWHADNANYTTHPIAKKKADANGLFDLYGNAMEWVTSEAGPAGFGGSYKDPTGKLNCSFSKSDNPDWNASDPQFPKSVWWLADGGFVGFRVVREISKQDS